jgi:predicted alpha/beta-fold hydrolase
MRAVAGGQSRRSSRPDRPAGTVRAVLRAADGVPIEALYEPGTARVTAPGTTRRATAPGTAEMAGPCTEDVAGDGRPGPDGASERPVVIVAHGFTGSVDRPAVRRVAEVFSRGAAVVTFSFRGHGASGGRSTVGDREVLDLAAAVAWARSFGHRRATTVGFSMGGSVVLRHAALYRDDLRARTDAGTTGARRRCGACTGW